MTEGEIFVAIKDAGAFGPQAYWTYVEDPNAPRTQRAAKRSPRRPGGSKNPGYRHRTAFSSATFFRVASGSPSALSLQPLQQRNTACPPTMTLNGTPMDPSGSPLT